MRSDPLTQLLAALAEDCAVCEAVTALPRTRGCFSAADKLAVRRARAKASTLLGTLDAMECDRDRIVHLEEPSTTRAASVHEALRASVARLTTTASSRGATQRKAAPDPELDRVAHFAVLQELRAAEQADQRAASSSLSSPSELDALRTAVAAAEARANALLNDCATLESASLAISARWELADLELRRQHDNAARDLRTDYDQRIASIVGKEQTLRRRVAQQRKEAHQIDSYMRREFENHPVRRRIGELRENELRPLLEAELASALGDSSLAAMVKDRASARVRLDEVSDAEVWTRIVSEATQTRRDTSGSDILLLRDKLSGEVRAVVLSNNSDDFRVEVDASRREQDRACLVVPRSAATSGGDVLITVEFEHA